MIDQEAQLEAVTRHVRRDPYTVSVILRRDFEAAHDAVWYAITDREELEKWFAPVSGELHDGGSYQIEGGPHGGIWECKPREHFMLTVGSAESLLTVELAHTSEGTTVQLTHGVPLRQAATGASAVTVGPGWDIALLGLDLYLRGEEFDAPIEISHSKELIEFTKGSIQRWVTEVEPSGTASSDDIRTAQADALAKYTKQ
ncbi:MAG TPA: SRPBCC domain-containing protein [Ruania sp.]|nr:SRPBCC domain-containing protein [Ruania sp.]